MVSTTVTDLVAETGLEPATSGLCGSLKHKSESFRLRFVLFTAIRSVSFPLFPSSPVRFFRVLGQNWVRHGAPAPTLSTACMDCSVACKELVGGVEGHPEVGTDVGDASIAGLGGEAVITVTEVPAVDGAVSQSDGQHGDVPILTQIRILDEGAASRQLPSGEALWVEGAILLQKVRVYILGEGAAAEEGVVHGDGEGHTVL